MTKHERPIYLLFFAQTMTDLFAQHEQRIPLDELNDTIYNTPLHCQLYWQFIFGFLSINKSFFPDPLSLLLLRFHSIRLCIFVVSFAYVTLVVCSETISLECPCNSDAVFIFKVLLYVTFNCTTSYEYVSCFLLSIYTVYIGSGFYFSFLLCRCPLLFLFIIQSS